MGHESTLVIRYTGQFLGQRDCDIFDPSGKLLGSVIDVERTPHPLWTAGARESSRADVRPARSTESLRSTNRGSKSGHENSVIVTDQHGTEVVAIKCPDKAWLVRSAPRCHRPVEIPSRSRR